MSEDTMLESEEKYKGMIVEKIFMLFYKHWHYIFNHYHIFDVLLVKMTRNIVMRRKLIRKRLSLITDAHKLKNTTTNMRARKMKILFNNQNTKSNIIIVTM